MGFNSHVSIEQVLNTLISIDNFFNSPIDINIINAG